MLQPGILRQATALATAAGLLFGLAAPAIAGPAPASTTYAGKTDQGHVITFRTNATGTRIVGMRIRIIVLCTDKSTWLEPIKQQSTDIVALDSQGRFTSQGSGPMSHPKGGTLHFAWHGRVNGASVTGAARLIEHRPGGVRCDSHSVRFTVPHSHT
jgi:hypothetical protein